MVHIKDSIVISIPIHLTVDFGFVVARGKQRQLRKLKIWEDKYLKEDETAKPADEQPAEEGKTEPEKDGANEEQVDDGEDISEDENDKPKEGGPRNNQFGDIVGYLEAKYAQGVMVQDPQEKMRQKRQRAKDRKAQKALKEGTEAEEGKEGAEGSDDLSVSDDADARSTYSTNSFLDDSMLVKGVAEQVTATSRLTKLEAEAQKKRAENAANDAPEGIMVDYDDDAFFVNIGELEMEDGYDSAEAERNILESGWGKSKPKKKKKKVPVEGEEKKQKDGASAKATKTKSKNVASDGSGAKKKAKTTDSAAATSAAAAGGATKKTSTSTSSVAKPVVVSETAKPSASAGTTPTKKKSKKIKLSDEQKKELHKLRGKARKCSNDVKKLYALVVKEMNAMDDEHMPRKGNMETIKVTLSVPEGKKGGDSLMFNNPRDASQMLRVTVPKSAKPGGNFMVSLPVPKTGASDMDENNFSKGMKEALHDFSHKYDEWLDAEYKVKETTGNPSKVTIHKARMNKYDELIKEFPDDLEIPVDISFLRKVVRRVTQNKKKRRDSAERNALGIPSSKRVKREPSKTDEGDEDETEDVDTDGNTKFMNLKVPIKSAQFEATEHEFDFDFAFFPPTADK